MICPNCGWEEAWWPHMDAFTTCPSCGEGELQDSSGSQTPAPSTIKEGKK